MKFSDGAMKNRLHRSFKRRQKDAVSLGQQADKQIEHLLIRRFDRLISVKRFVFLWLVLFVLLLFIGVMQLRSLSAYYQELKPVPGGLYHEGIVGNFTNANPLFATGKANTAVSRLVFSGLFRYDTANNLVGDLAVDWHLNTAEDIYSVNLKHGVTWQDGRPFTADDVVFTYSMIQNIETQSALYSSWKDIKVTKSDPYTVNFDLPNALSSFPHSLTNGILPYHLLKDVSPVQMRSASFNTSPVGTGPFIWKFIEVVDRGTDNQQQRISLESFDNYLLGRPKLDGFNLITFTNEQQLIKAFKKKQINAMGSLDAVPEEIANEKEVEIYTTPLTAMVMAFFNNSKPSLQDVQVRKALVTSVDKKQMAGLFENRTQILNSPLLPDQLGYNSNILQAPYNVSRANQLLDAAGWVKGLNGLRSKDGQVLALELSTQETPEYANVAQYLQRQWAKVGVKVTVHYYDSDYMQGTIIANHDYDILLHGVSIGVDPDVFAYWDSSQASVGSQGHFNLSEYKSKVVDQALESARTRADNKIRVVKYKNFLSAWTADAPALVLYRPNSIYISRGPVFNFDRKSANSATDRYYNVYKWMIRQQKQTI